jgi:hypothetical protein
MGRIISKSVFKKFYFEIASLVISFFLIIFKIFGLIQWNWLIVTVLLWFPIAFILCIFCILFIPGLLFLVFRDKKWDERQ